MLAGVIAIQIINLCNLLWQRYGYALHSRYSNLGSACVSTSQAELFLLEVCTQVFNQIGEINVVEGIRGTRENGAALFRPLVA